MNLRPTLRLALWSLLVLAIGVGAAGAATTTQADDTTPVNGGTLQAAIPDNVDHLDPGLSYTNEGWEIFEATNDGLLTYERTDDQATSSKIVPAPRIRAVPSPPFTSSARYESRPFRR